MLASNCKNCGNTFVSDSNFCRRCGEKREVYGASAAPMATGSIRTAAPAATLMQEPNTQVQIEEQIVEVPTILYQEKVVEVPKVQETILLKQVPRVEVQEVTKEVVRPIYEVTEKIVEVPHTLVQERIEEVPKVEFVPLVKQVPKTQVREVQKQVGVPHYQARERIVEVPTTMVAEQMVEVPQVQIEELLKEVPRPEVKIVAKPVEKPVNEYVERIVEVPHTTIQECIIEVPKVEVQEIVKQVPRPEVQVVDRQVEKLEVQYVEKLVEVPQIIYEEPALHSQSMAWLTTEHEMEMQAFVHQHLLSMLSPFSQHLKDLKDKLEALRSEMEKKSEQLKHTNTVVKQHGHELMTLTLDVNQAHTEVGNLRKELLPEIEKKIDEKTVELEFTKVYEELQVGKSNLEAYNTVHSKLESDLRELVDFSRSTASNLAEKVGELSGLRESNDFLSQCYAGICGRVEQAKRVADDTHEAFKKFQHSASNQLDDIKKSCLPRISSKIESLETRIHRIVKDAAMDEEDLQQAKLQIESIKDALSSMDETIQLQEKDKLTKVDTLTSHASFINEEASQRKSKMEQLHQKLNQTKEELTEFTNNLHADLARRVADLSTLLDAKTANIRTNSSAIRSLEASLNSTNSELRRTTARVSEQNIVQDRLVEQARVAETEIHGLFDFRKESIPKLQEHDAGLARFELRLQSVDRDIQNHTKHLTDINSEVVNVQGDVINMADRVEVAHDLLRGVGRGLHDVHKQVDVAQGKIHGEKPSVLPTLPSSMQVPRPSTAPLRRRPE